MYIENQSTDRRKNLNNEQLHVLADDASSTFAKAKQARVTLRSNLGMVRGNNRTSLCL